LRIEATGAPRDGHAYGRTLAASLGFADDDKRHPLHELACHYLMQPPTAVRLAESFWPPSASKHNPTFHCPGEMYVRWGHEVLCDAVREFVEYAPEIRGAVMIAKGEGKYRTTIGFVDVVALFVERWNDTKLIKGWSCQKHADHGYHMRCDEHRCCSDATAVSDWKRERVDGDRHSLGIEVKGGPKPISDVVRQINLYREYMQVELWVLATPYELSGREIDILDRERIKHVHLGDGFREFCEVAKHDKPGRSAVVL
jgi:hypothetical protein